MQKPKRACPLWSLFLLMMLGRQNYHDQYEPSKPNRQGSNSLNIS